ncbi:MAG TPA: DUF1444 domain-containing protein [Pseudogracilibacillus sp.]|nr:DUF1444 domain-containing protein [Pseudogracilibacillus sp.]
MSMTSFKLKRILEERLLTDDFRTSFNRDNDEFRIEWKDSGEGLTLTLPNVVAKYKDKGDVAIDEIVNHIQEALKIMNVKHDLKGKEKHIFPVIRATSFPTETNAGKKLITTEHTAETRIFYALDLGKSYRLIDQALLDEEEWTKERIEEIALFNIRSLSTDFKQDRVRDNNFYFIATQDGYDASRILNEAFLQEMKANAKGELTVSVPHQDVLIIADIENEVGYDILAQLTMKFFAEGTIPITSLPFVYDEKGLEPIFILAKNPENPKNPKK